MSATNPKTDVVVVGMPSCGKTVFFTVLGKKFTNLVGGKRAAPLGFRMGTCDEGTAKVIAAAYSRLRARLWPKPTETRQVMPLRWEVFTGRRRVFGLYSMDIAGETFKQAFDISDDNDGAGEGKKISARAAGPDNANDSGGELYHGNNGDNGAAAIPGQGEEYAVGQLKDAIETAKVVCFMVNVALPDRHDGTPLSDADEIKLARFRRSVVNMYLTLRERRDLREKTVIVLTQTHLHEGEIERAGGPVMYLGDVCGGEAAELSNLAKENDIPVIAVSAIDVDCDDNALPPINSPGDIPSAGLFGFLLTVSGMVARSDNLAAVMEEYRKYQRERVEYLKCPAQGIKTRLPQSEKLSEAAKSYIDACMHYLDDPGNLAEKGAGESISSSDIEMYRRCTKSDPEIKSAADRVFLERDKLWDAALRRAAMSSVRTGKRPSANDIYGEVRTGMLGTFPEKRGNDKNDEFVYGFSEDDLCYGSAASSFEKWVALNIDEYIAELDGDMAELPRLYSDAASSVESLAEQVGDDGFAERMSSARGQLEALRTKVELFKGKWPGLETPKVSGALKGVGALAASIDGAAAAHEKMIADEETSRREREVANGIENLNNAIAAAKDAIGLALRHAGSPRFQLQLKKAVDIRDYLVRQLELSKDKWIVEYEMKVPELPGLDDALKEIDQSIGTARRRDSVVSERKVVAAARRKRLVAVFAIVLALGAAAVSCRFFCSSRNVELFDAARKSFERDELTAVGAAYDSMYEIPALGVSRDEYFSPGLGWRLHLALAIRGARLAAMKDERKLLDLEMAEDFKKLALPSSAVATIEEAHRQLAVCTNLASSVTFDSLRAESDSLSNVLSQITFAAEAVGRAVNDADVACRDARAGLLCDGIEALLKEADGLLSDGNPDDAVVALQDAEGRIGGFGVYAECADSVQKRFADIKKKVELLNERLKSAKIAMFLKKTVEMAKSRRWMECIMMAGQVLALDKFNQDALRIQQQAENEIEAKESAEKNERAAIESRTAGLRASADEYAKKEWDAAEALLFSGKKERAEMNYSRASDLFIKAEAGFSRVTKEAAKQWTQIVSAGNEGSGKFTGEANAAARPTGGNATGNNRPYRLSDAIIGCRNCGYRLTESDRNSWICPKCAQNLL